MSRKFAVFDIDGTLIRWQLYHAVADELARRGHFEADDYQAIKTARMTWKRRASDDSFRQYEDALVKLVDSTISNIPSQDFLLACRQVLTEYKDQVYTFTRDLIKRLKDDGYLLFAISASQRQIVATLANYYGFDDWAGSVYEVNDGAFTGQKLVLASSQKPKVLSRLILKYDATTAGSIAVGDSESDIPMLETVEQPIAFNPTRQLYEHAHAKGWNIVVERKNVVYYLEPHDGSYLLAPPSA